MMALLVAFPSLMHVLTISVFLLNAIRAQNASSPSSLNVTTIAAQNSSSVLQCWQLTSPLSSSSTPGTSGALNMFLSNATNTSYIVIPPRFDGGIHNAPNAQWVVFLSGLAHITLPNTTVGAETEVWVTGGKYGIIFAADTSDVSRYGHATQYPSNADTVVFQVPVGGVGEEAIPAHRVLYDGPCQWSELAGV